MDTRTLTAALQDPRTIAMIVVAIIALLIIVWAMVRHRRRVELRQRFGPEYDRTLREHGVGGAETVLTQREKRVEKFSIRELTLDERERFITDWRVVQSRFVENPRAAVNDADALVTRLLQTRGYPVSEFSQRAADLSVDHPRLVDNYRAAHEITLRERQGQATTEDLRSALLYYRSLFDDLMTTTTPVIREAA